uniref:C-type lectin domain-containing protein n=1 Tax=Clytia hemisphaerica TaxID=252671 RepID=A0A7M5VG70_9CNID
DTSRSSQSNLAMKLSIILFFLVVAATSIECYGVTRLFRIRTLKRVFTSTYLINKDPLDMHAAAAECAKCGGFLATINNVREHHYLVGQLNLLGIKSAWIGLIDKSTEGKFVWPSTPAPGFKKWCPHEPNNFGTGEDCVELKADTERCLNDLFCNVKKPYICEINEVKTISNRLM